MFPVSKKDFTTKIDDEDVYEASHMNDVQDEVRSMQDFIGTAKAEQLSLMSVLQDYRTGLAATIVSGDTISVPASEMIIDERGVRNTAALTRDLSDDITASTSTDYYLFVVDDADGTFSLEFRAALTAVDDKRKIATVTTNDSDATVIDTIVDDDIPQGGIGTIPAFSVYDAGATISHNTHTKVTWTTEIFDTNGDFASGKFTPTVAGKYLLIATSSIDSVADGKRLFTRIYKNGVAANSGTSHTGIGTTRSNSTFGIVEANGTTDYFEIFVYHDHGSDRSLLGGAENTYFQGFKIAD